MQVFDDRFQAESGWNAVVKPVGVNLIIWDDDMKNLPSVASVDRNRKTEMTTNDTTSKP